MGPTPLQKHKTQGPQTPQTSVRCQRHSRISVGVCTKQGCKKPILICDACLTFSDDSAHKCPMIPLEDLRACSKHFQSLPASTSQLRTLVRSYYQNLQTTYVSKIHQKQQTVLNRLRDYTLGVTLTNSQAKIYDALITMELKHLEVEHHDVTVMMELAKGELKKIQEQELEEITRQIQENKQKVEGVRVVGVEASDMLEKILGIKQHSEVTCTVDDISSLVVTHKEEQAKLKSMFELRLQKYTQMKLIYRASQFYFSAETFHERTDIHNNTLLLVRSKKGNIFGGFTPCYWKATFENTYEIDSASQSFLFSLTKFKTYNLKHEMRDTAIQNSPDSGPIFGKGHDLILCNGCNKSVFSHSNLGKSYECEEKYGGEEAVCELAGEKHFLVEEYEVWQLM